MSSSETKKNTHYNVIREYTIGISSMKDTIEVSFFYCVIITAVGSISATGQATFANRCSVVS